MKKGFTLVEVLAVITILGILSLITVPIISNSVEKSKQKLFKETIYGIIDATKLYIADNDFIVADSPIDVTGPLLEYENKKEIKGGTITYNKTTKKYTVSNITNGEYCAVGTSENFEVTKGNCE